jgi:hypothetical protein
MSYELDDMKNELLRALTQIGLAGMWSMPIGGAKGYCSFVMAMNQFITNKNKNLMLSLLVL